MFASWWPCCTHGKSPCTWSAAASRFPALMPPPPLLLDATCCLRQCVKPWPRISLPLLAMSESSVTMCPHTQEMIEPVARELGIKMDNVYGNSLRWDENGEYLSGPHSCLPFPPSQPPSLSVAGVWWWRALVSSDVSALMSSLSLSLSLLAVYSCAREHGLMRGHLQDL